MASLILSVFKCPTLSIQSLCLLNTYDTFSLVTTLLQSQPKQSVTPIMAVIASFMSVSVEVMESLKKQVIIRARSIRAWVIRKNLWANLLSCALMQALLLIYSSSLRLNNSKNLFSCFIPLINIFPSERIFTDSSSFSFTLLELISRNLDTLRYLKKFLEKSTMKMETGTIIGKKLQTSTPILNIISKMLLNRILIQKENWLSTVSMSERARVARASFPWVSQNSMFPKLMTSRVFSPILFASVRLAAAKQQERNMTARMQRRVIPESLQMKSWSEMLLLMQYLQQFFKKKRIMMEMRKIRCWDRFLQQKRKCLSLSF